MRFTSESGLGQLTSKAFASCIGNASVMAHALALLAPPSRTLMVPYRPWKLYMYSCLSLPLDLRCYLHQPSSSIYISCSIAASNGRYVADPTSAALSA